MRIIDTHAHYDSEAFDADREELLGSLPGRGITAVVNMAASMEGARQSMELARRYPFVYAGTGLHPDDIGTLCEPDGEAVPQSDHWGGPVVWHEETLEELRKLARDPRCLAIGEIGLDYYWKVQPREVQQAGFIRLMELSQELDLPINVHSREAAQDTFDLIRAHHAGTTGGVLHCYSGSPEMAREYVKMGYYLGIGGVVTFKNARTLVSVVEQIPLEHLVTETDCPYLTPAPNRGKRNDSTRIADVIARIAQIKGMDEEETAAILLENACRLYRTDFGAGADETGMGADGGSEDRQNG